MDYVLRGRSIDVEAPVGACEKRTNFVAAVIVVVAVGIAAEMFEIAALEE